MYIMGVDDWSSGSYRRRYDLMLWDGQDSRRIGSLDLSSTIPLAYSPDGLLAIGVSNLLLWDGEQIRALTDFAPSLSPTHITSIAWVP